MAALTAPVGVNATKRAAILAKTSGIGDFIDGANEWGTKLRCIYDEYTVASGDTVAASATLTFGTLPKGAKPLFALWTQADANQNATGGIQIGGVAATGTTDITTMTGDTTQILSINNTFTTTFTSAAVAVTVVLSATNHLNALANVTLSIFYVLED